MNLAPSFMVLDRAAVNHKPREFYALFSGGHDSLTATSVAFAWAKKRGIKLTAAHINTTIGVPETNQFVRDVCEKQGWPLRELLPPKSYEEIVMETQADDPEQRPMGFPGPGFHAFPYNRLKERCLGQLVRESKEEWKDRVMFITGVRSKESVRRMRHVEQIQRDGATVWAAPIWDFDKSGCHRVMEYFGLPRNPVVDLLHMSGECLCGAFARADEMKELEGWFPDIADRIHALERRVEAVGGHACQWGKRRPPVHRDQMKMAIDTEGLSVGSLCDDCEIGQRGAVAA